MNSTVARVTLANEMLRRRIQSERDSGGRPRPIGLELRGDLMHVSFEELPATRPGPEPGSRRRGSRTLVSPTKAFYSDDQIGGVATGISTGRRQLGYVQDSLGTNSLAPEDHDSTSDKIPDGDSEATENTRGNNKHRRQSKMWRTGLLYLDRGDSAIIAALANAGFNTQQQASGSPTRRFSDASDSENSRDGRPKTDSSNPPSASQWVLPVDGNGHKFAPTRTRGEDSANTLSPTSDTTLFEEPMPYTLNQIPEDDRFPDYFSYDNTESDALLKIDRDGQQLVQKRRLNRHQRAPSTTPSSPSTKSPFSGGQRGGSRQLPVRAKTSEGLLQLQANPTKSERPTQNHQRRISLGLPIKSPVSPSPPEETQGPITKPRSALPSRRPTHVPELASPTTLNQQERDLEYKHRHTFIGTASLDDFLEILEVQPSRTASKAAIAKAFIVLAASERLLARQASSTPVGWELVPRVTPEVPNYDYVAQAHVRLGSITLWQFLELIPFDEREEAGAMSVVEGFSAASHMDSKAGVGMASKARAFRSWMVEQSDNTTETRVSRYAGAS
jgi:hypothetical protein